MAQPFVGEIKMFAGNFAINTYAFCNGQLMSIAENDVLFALIGTTYGGDGQTTFALPDLQGRIPVHQGTLSGTGFNLGEKSGTETVTLISQQIPAHSHPLNANKDAGTVDTPNNNYVAAVSKNFFSTSAPDNTMGNTSITPSTGGNQPHDNMMPYLCITFLIALYGIFPPRN